MHLDITAGIADAQILTVHLGRTTADCDLSFLQTIYFINCFYRFFIFSPELNKTAGIAIALAIGLEDFTKKITLPSALIVLRHLLRQNEQ